MASASILSLAIGFGSQGPAEDIVNGLTIVVPVSFETVFKQEVVYALKALDLNYQDWMVTANYEVEARSDSLL